ncbi:MAG TPA: TlpA disulfide reductase family protein [Pyrinomonadaceae bacterium]|jgi:thiol-disulfide isomerase/thioredoxin
MTRLISPLILSALVLALVSSSSARHEQQAGAQRKATASSPAPVVREIDLAGLKKLLSREGKERRPLLVNFWATWCEPCRAEFPDLVSIDNEYRARGLDFITVSIDDVSEINSTVPAFLREMRATMPAYLLNTTEQDAAIQFVDPRWAGSLPATFLYDAQGKVVFKHLGRIKPDELRAAIKAVISDK